MSPHPGLSILIPVYNQDCRRLLTDLSRQAQALSIEFELIVMEDGSTLYVQENEAAARNQPNTNHILLPHNIGRSAIRNRLAMEARYDWLLFMDCDSKIISPSYLHHYEMEIKAWHEQASIVAVCGGRIYGPRGDVDSGHILHWTYGTHREPDGWHPNASRPFLSNNFLARQSLFRIVRFDEQLKGYGHEDTLFGIELKRHNLQIRFTANPIMHEGLDDNLTFLRKAEESMRNLSLIKQRLISTDECRTIRILNALRQVEHWKLKSVVRLLGKWLSPLIRKQLLGSHPHLYLLDFYKLAILCAPVEDHEKSSPSSERIPTRT